MPDLNLTHAECRARAAALAVESYRVELDLTGDGATFPSRTTIVLTTRGGPTWVDVVADRVRLDGRDVEGYDGARLPVTLPAGRHELVVDAECRYSRTGEGLHRFTDPEDGATYLYTHFEPTDARRVFAHFEQPDLKARFTFVVTAPPGWRVLSGQPEVARDGATVTFAPTPPQSSYLTAVAAGPYHRVDAAAGDVALGVLCRASMAAHLDADTVVDVTRRGLAFYADAFGVPYPWGKYDSIFVPEYNIGAMENPGLVTFTEAFLHRGGATRADRARLAVTVLHEMAHMWFGDLVTPRWWDGTWLKESFADLMGYHVSAAATAFDDAWTAFAGRRKSFAYHADQLPTTHPVVARVDDLEAARQNFDGIAYAKGASALKQLMAYVGPEVFFAGARDYFARHAYGNTELADLLACLSRGGRDLTAWSRAWLETSGISRITPSVQTGPDGRITRLELVQTGAVQRPHRLVVGLYDGALRRERAVEVDITGPRTEVPAAVGGPADLVLVNDDDLTYAKVRLDPRSLATARAHLAAIPGSLSRAVVWSALWDATRDAELPAADYLDVAFGQVGAEADATLRDAVLGQAATAVERYLPAADRPVARERQLAACRAGLAAAGPDDRLGWVRHLVRAASTTPSGVVAVRALLAGPAVDADLRWSCWAALAAQGAATAAELDAVLAADDTMSGRRAHLYATACLPGTRAATWERATTDAALTNDQLRALVSGVAHPADPPGPEYAPRYFAALTGWWAGRSMVMATVLARGLFPAPTPDAVTRARTWLDTHPTAPAALRRIVVEELDDAERALRAQAAAPSPGESPRSGA